jgi:uncharacterized protein YciI
MEQQTEITDEFVRQNVAAGRQYCARIFKAGANRDQPPAEADRIQMEHLRYLFRLKAEGKLLINGPVVDDPEIKGISIFNTTDVAEVRRISEADPAVRAGRLIYEIYLWFGTPGQCLPE